MVAGLPPRVLARIFAYVCPHSRDEAYRACEDSGVNEDGCPLCDTRDLAHCARVCRRWAGSAQSTLYHSVRFDAVHYCDREYDLTEKRKRRSFFERNGELEDPSQARLQLFVRTVRANRSLGKQVALLKMPYMTREACKPELAQAVSALPTLRYVDLPDGVFGQGSSSEALRTELIRRCPNLRRIKFGAGADDEALRLTDARCWQHLEILELVDLHLDAQALLYVLAAFPSLQEIKLGHLALDDTLFSVDPSIPPFPPVRTLALDEVPSISAAGLASYLSRHETRAVLNHLSLSATGVHAHELHKIFAAAPHLRSVTLREVVSRPFPLGPLPPLASSSLTSLGFEILPLDPASPNSPEETYYSYLASSLLAGGLPSLAELFTYSASLPDLLLFPPTVPFGNAAGRSPSPHRSFLGARSASPSRLSSVSSLSSGVSDGLALPLPSTAFPGLRTPLRLYTRPAATPEIEWSLTAIDPPSPANGRQGSFRATRPLSMVVGPRGRSPDGSGPRGLDPELAGGPEAKAGGADGAVLAGNHEFGGFLAVPAEDRGPARRTHAKKGSWNSEWMG